MPRWSRNLALLAWAPLLVAWAVAYVAWLSVWGPVLRAWFWRAHASRGRRILFVTSRSPNWHAYIEENVLPRLRGRAVVLDWSERRRWPRTSPWEARFFRRFAGTKDFVPLALVLAPRGRIRRVRFHRAFLDAKHGRHAALRDAEKELFEIVEGLQDGRPARGSGDP